LWGILTPSAAPDDKAQTSFTDPEMKMMPQSNKGWDYATNAQVSVDGHCQIIVSCFVTAAVNDKEQAVPLAEATLANLEQAGIERPRGAAGQAQKSRVGDIPFSVEQDKISRRDHECISLR
jgi:hypothetical protein